MDCGPVDMGENYTPIVVHVALGCGGLGMPITMGDDLCPALRQECLDDTDCLTSSLISFGFIADGGKVDRFIDRCESVDMLTECRKLAITYQVSPAPPRVVT